MAVQGLINVATGWTESLGFDLCFNVQHCIRTTRDVKLTMIRTYLRLVGLLEGSLDLPKPPEAWLSWLAQY